MRAVMMPLPMLAACGPAPIVNPKVPDAPAAPALVQHEPDGCGMVGFQGMLGHSVADVDRAVAASGAMLGRTVRPRVIPFGSMVTQEYDAGRVNFTLDEGGLVTGVRCG